MVYMNFPTSLTEEEIVLQNKYAKLRKKKKALQMQSKAPRQEPEPPHPVKRPSSQAKDAKELAKKLIRSGAIRSIGKKDDLKDKTTFKRSKGLERKLTGSDRALSSYQPFSAVHGQLTEPGSSIGSGGGVSQTHSDIKNKLYQASRVSDRDDSDKRMTSLPGAGGSDRPRSGHTVYVHGDGLTEPLARRILADCGLIVNVSMEIENNCGFVTFDKVDSAQRAISRLNGVAMQDVLQDVAAVAGSTRPSVQHGAARQSVLEVSFARRQPNLDPLTEATASTTWSTIAASHSQKGIHHKEVRDLVTYDDDFF